MLQQKTLKYGGRGVIQSYPLVAEKYRLEFLKGIHIPVELVPLAIDEFPAIFIAASCAQGETVLTGAKELRVKESDRIQVMADGLDMLGIENEVLEEGIKIQGGTFQQPKGMIESHHDHRISTKELYTLFPKGPAKQAGKIAGLPETKRKGGY
jgi:5-enolpyruvylshikimate-3-phosphate synthase